MTKFFLIFICILFNTCFAIDIPKLNSHVTDQANVISSNQEQEIIGILKEFKENSGIEVGIFTIDTLNQYPIEKFGLELGRKNSIGNKDQDTGLIYILITEDKKSRIEVGYGLEGTFTDAAVFNIQQELNPFLKNQNYDQAIATLVNSIIETANNEYAASSSSKQDTEGFLTFFIIMGLSVLGSILGKSKSIWLGGAIGGGSCLIGSIILAKSFGFTIGITIFGTIAGLIFDYLYSNGKIGNNRFGGGGSFGGGSFGGGSSFGGGGGSFGGGGANSSW